MSLRLITLYETCPKWQFVISLISTNISLQLAANSYFVTRFSRLFLSSIEAQVIITAKTIKLPQITIFDL